MSDSISFSSLSSVRSMQVTYTFSARNVRAIARLEQRPHFQGSMFFCAKAFQMHSLGSSPPWFFHEFLGRRVVLTSWFEQREKENVSADGRVEMGVGTSSSANDLSLYCTLRR